MKVAALLTSYNRKEKTIECLYSLNKQEKVDDIKLDIVLTDDNSSDGTVSEVAKKFPDVTIIQGTGSLFWAGGMRESWRHASQNSPDFYFLVNDDTILKPYALYELVQGYNYYLENNSMPCICIGSTINPETGLRSYGGRNLYSKHKIQNYLIEDNKTYVECDLGNANLMLVSKEIYGTIGMLSEKYTHGIADYDYTLTAKRNGFKSIVLSGNLGFCIDDHGNNWKSANSSIKERIEYLYSPKGLSYKEYLYFIRSHFPLHFPIAFVKLWVKTLFPILWQKLKT